MSGVNLSTDREIEVTYHHECIGMVTLDCSSVTFTADALDLTRLDKLIEVLKRSRKLLGVTFNGVTEL